MVSRLEAVNEGRRFFALAATRSIRLCRRSNSDDDVIKVLVAASGKIFDVDICIATAGRLLKVSKAICIGGCIREVVAIGCFHIDVGHS